MKCFKYIFFLVGLLFCVKTNAQNWHAQPPLSTFKDFDFKKAILKSETKYYQKRLEEYEFLESESYTFDKNGRILEQAAISTGEFGNNYKKRYIYKGEQLDSTYDIISVPDTPDDITVKKYIYNSKKQLIEVLTKGTSYEFNDEFTYSLDGSLQNIQRYMGERKTITTSFFYKDKMIDYVVEYNNEYTDTPQTQFFYYKNNKIFAINIKGQNKLKILLDDFGFNITEIEGNVEELLANYRKPNPLYPNIDKDKIFKIYESHDTQNQNGDWIKSLQISRIGNQIFKKFAFRKLEYLNGETSGDFKLDFIFEAKMSEKYKLDEME